MVLENGRLAHVFIWKEGSKPDLAYARQVLGAVNPNALSAVSGENPPLTAFGIAGQWPDDPWTHALRDMRAVPTPDGSRWADTSRYDLAGWEGTDQRTGARIFIVTAYRKSNAPAVSFQGAPAQAPTYPQAVPHVPYYPQRPTGPVSWPPQPEPQPQAQPQPQLQVPAQPYNPPSGPLPPLPQGYAYGQQQPTPTPPEQMPDNYAPFYAGFGPRLAAGLIDFFFMGFLQAVPALLYVLIASGGPTPPDFWAWVLRAAPFLCLGALIFAAYHVVQWSVWGQTAGMSMLGMRVVGPDGDKPSLGRAMLRIMGYFFSLSIGGIGGFLLINFDSRRQGLHDKIAETYVVPERVNVPVPPGLPGYPNNVTMVPPGTTALPALPPGVTSPALGMAAVASAGTYEVVQIGPEQRPEREEDEDTGFREISSVDLSLSTVSLLPELEEEPPVSQVTMPNLSIDTGTLGQPERESGEQGIVPVGAADRMVVDRARELFRRGIELMERGVRPTDRGYRVEPSAARQAAEAFHHATEFVPTSVTYRYFYAVALRYSEGFEAAISEFRRVLELDPSHYEARQQVAYGQRWHDAFAYPPWVFPAPIEPGMPLPPQIQSLLPPGGDPVTRLVLLREGSNKVVTVLSRTPRSAWARPPALDMNARIDLTLSRTPHGPILAFYIIVEDRPDDPYKGETFLNPHDPGHPTYDACLLGQHLLAQLARQDRTYLIFVDETNRLLLSRKLMFDPRTQVSIARSLYEVQTLPAQVMDAERFQQAAEWHMEHFSLDQIK
jgi:uncharacterized RDD family membrane protein YckC